MTKRQYKRKIALQWTPEIFVDGQRITLKTGCWSGATRYECNGELSVWCAAQLVKNLRKALRQIRDNETKMLNAIVESAEGPV